MRRTPAVTEASEPRFSTISVRLPLPLSRELARLAERDGNHVSSTVRRLLSAGLRMETRGTETSR